MKQYLSLVLIGVLMASVTGATEIYLSPSGNDANPGTPEQPFATLERARAAARQAKGATVTLAAGTYRLTQTFALDERDSGTTYRGVNARITGSVAIPNDAVKTVTDPAILERLLPAVRGKVLEMDLRKLGITDFGAIGPRGFRRPYVPAPLELFMDDEPLAVAQWPNPGEPGVPIGTVLDKGPVSRNGEKPTRGGTFEFTTARPARWSKADDVWITGIFDVGWADNTVRVESFDLVKHTLTTVQSHMYGFSCGKPWNTWVALNLLEEIDLPGEFMADQQTGKLYFLPPEGKLRAQSRLEVSVLKAPLIAIEGATNVVFDGVNIECSRGMGVYMERGASNRIQNATLRNLGMVAVCIGKGVTPDPDYRQGFTGQPVSRELGSWHEHIYDNTTFNREAGTGQGISNCEIYNIGAGAISLGGGDRLKLQPAGNFVENCHLHHFNRWDRTYKGAVNIDGAGNRVAHCLIHDAPGLAIYLHGNDHVIEFNEIHHAAMEGDDMGAFYLGRDPSERGNVIRYNYWHDLAPSLRTVCLYLDDAGGDGTRIYGNVFRNAGNNCTVLINGGSDITVTNNIFIDCKSPVRLGNMGVWRTREGLFEARLKAVGYDQSPWREHYPEFIDYLEARPQMPRRNLFARNLLVSTKLNEVQGIEFRDNRTAATDPGHANVGIPGFKPIPFEQIGLKKSPEDTTPTPRPKALNNGKLSSTKN